MKKIWSLILCLLLLLSLSACRDDAPDASLSGGQDSTGDTSATGDPTGDGKEYDADGNLILEPIIDAKGTYYGKRVYTYADGLCATQSEYNAEDVLTVTYTFEYNAGVLSGKLTERFENGAVAEKSKEEYDAAGNVIRKTLYGTDGAVEMVSEYTLDAQGSCVEKKDYSYTDGAVSSCVTYDADMNVQKEEQYDENGKVFWSIRYEYEYGLRVKGIESDGSYQEYQYDKEGNETGIIYYDPDGNVTDKVIYEEEKQPAE